VEIKLAHFENRGRETLKELNAWLKENPHITRVSLCAYRTEYCYVIDFFYTEPKPESYREPGQPG
jgi:hypothetical protein